MHNTSAFVSIVVFLSLVLAGCAAIGGIFKAGVWTGTILIVIILAVIIFIISKLSSRNKGV